ncbi:unnamed protein product [Adineta ricciae]|uniref:Uncharacterized protein n=1 Tax=Adineta ricciae TaxID=249248 RepID=A0A815JD95_ADIRI|nr:unnamed protein product [Adineta ricciae]
MMQWLIANQGSETMVYIEYQIDRIFIVKDDHFLETSNLFSLPNDLLLDHVFVYLRSTDLVYTFGQLCNRLLYAHLHHVDLSTSDTFAVSIDEWLCYLSSTEKKTLSLRINLHCCDSLPFSQLSKLIRLNLQITSGSPNVSEIRALAQLKELSITSIYEKLERLEGLTLFIWQVGSCLETVSAFNWFILDYVDVSPHSLRSLLVNEKLTRLSLDLCHINFVASISYQNYFVF